MRVRAPPSAPFSSNLSGIANDELTPDDGLPLYHARLTKERIPARIAPEEDRAISPPVPIAAQGADTP